MTNQAWQNQGRQEHGWFGHGKGDANVALVADVQPAVPELPTLGLASTYADRFVGHPVRGANRQGVQSSIYTHGGYTDALLGDHVGAVPFGTRLSLEYQGRRVIVEVNDTGAGAPQQDRVLDLSRAAMATLIGKKVTDITDKNAAVIRLDRITIVPSQVHVGP